eukprot:Rmarinus@m.5906
MPSRAPSCHHCYAVAGRECHSHSEAASINYCWGCRKLLCREHSAFHATHWASVSHETTDMASLPSKVLEAYRLVDPQLFSPCVDSSSCVGVGSNAPRNSITESVPHDSSTEANVDLAGTEMTPEASSSLWTACPVLPDASVSGDPVVDTESWSAVSSPDKGARGSEGPVDDVLAEGCSSPSLYDDEVFLQASCPEDDAVGSLPNPQVVPGSFSSPLRLTQSTSQNRLSSSTSQEGGLAENTCPTGDTDVALPASSASGLQVAPEKPDSDVLESVAEDVCTGEVPIDDATDTQAMEIACKVVPMPECEEFLSFPPQDALLLTRPAVEADGGSPIHATQGVTSPQPIDGLSCDSADSDSQTPGGSDSSLPAVAGEDALLVHSAPSAPTTQSTSDVPTCDSETMVLPSSVSCAPSTSGDSAEIRSKDQSIRAVPCCSASQPGLESQHDPVKADSKGSKHRKTPAEGVPLVKIVNLSDVAKKKPVLPKLGVSLQVLEEFVAHRCDGRDSLVGLTTRDICERYVKPDTLRARSSYCELLKKEGHPGIREATVYVSHAWDDLFLEVVDALTQHVKERPSEESDEESNESSDDVVLWFDLFSLNQHDKVAITVEWLKEALHAAIPEFRENVLVLTASGNCRPLRRTWCLYEVFCMGDNNFWVARWGDVKIPLNLDVDCLWGWYSTFPFELSDCSSAEEKARIIDAVRESHSSCERVDVRVTSLLIMDLRKHTKDEDAKLMMSSKYYIINLQHSLAADLAKLIVEARRKTLSPTHPDVLSAESFHGCIVCHVDVPQAVSMLSKTLEKQRNILGSDNKDTILTAVRLGVALSRDKKEKEAIELLLNTPSSPALYVLAEVYTARGKIEEAIAAGEKALAGFVSELGEHNFATYATMVALGRKYLQAEQLDDAVRLLQAAWEGFGQLVGRDYMISLSACLHLASALSKQGEDSKAIPLFEEALLKHSMSARFAGNDAVMPFEDSLLRSYITASQSEDAAKFGNFLLENRKKALGVEHTDTMNISMLLSCIQRFVDERLPLTEEAFRDIQKALGITHPRTVNAVFHLGQHLRSQRKFETAAKILKEVLDANRSPSEEPSVIIMLLNDLAMHYGEMRKIADATKALEEAWDIQGRIPLLPIATRLLLTLAFFYAAAGEPKRGSDLIANALGAHEQELAKDHAAYLQLQATLYALSEGRDYGSVHRWRASMFDEMDPDPWKCMFSLVWEDVSKRWCRGVVGTDDVWADDPGKSKHVTAVLEKIAQKKESVDNSDLEYLSLLKLAVVFLTDLSRHTEAEPLARELLTKQRVAAGADSEDAVEATILLASVCSLAGKAKDAVELYEGALLKAKKSQGPSALSLSIDALLGLAEHYRSQRQLEESRRLLATFLKRKTKQLGLAHMHILNVKFRLASILYEVGKYQLAVTSVRDVALTLGSTVGTDTVPAMQARFLLAQFLWASAQYVPSKPLFEEAITLWPDVYGSEHPLTRRVTQRVQDLRKKNEPLLVLVSSAEARDAGASSSSSSSVVASVAGATPVIVRRARRRKK